MSSIIYTVMHLLPCSRDAFTGQSDEATVVASCIQSRSITNSMGNERREGVDLPGGHVGG